MKPKRQCALIIVDVQPGFLNDKNRGIVGRIVEQIKRGAYDLIVESVFHAEKGSLWDLQTDWYLPKDENCRTVDEIISALSGKNVIHVEKQAKSVFKGDDDLHSELQKQGVTEVHVVGVDTNDCVLATAYEAFDLGYFTYVIEDCTSTSDEPHLADAALKILRHVNLTDRSRRE